MINIARELLHDKAAWIGTVGSTITTGFAALEAKSWFPQDMQGWLAAGLTSITIVYIAVKVLVVIHDRRRGKKVAVDD
jgi:hypothetical protein